MNAFREGLSWSEHAELVEAARIRFQSAEIDKKEFRKLLAALGFNAVEIDSEVRSISDD